MSRARIMKGYYFSANNRLRYGDGRTIEQGITHMVDVTPRCCHAGLHASKSPLDALVYGGGSWCWYVSVSGQIHEQSNKKFCGQRREYLWGFDAGHVLRAFARKCTLDVIDFWNPPPVVVDFLKTGDECLRAAARDAARIAARDAAWAARDAARAAARAKQNRRLIQMLHAGAKK